MMTNSLGVFLVACLIEYVTKSALCSIFVLFEIDISVDSRFLCQAIQRRLLEVISDCPCTFYHTVILM